MGESELKAFIVPKPLGRTARSDNPIREKTAQVRVIAAGRPESGDEHEDAFSKVITNAGSPDTLTFRGRLEVWVGDLPG